MSSAAERWKADLESWAIPQHILDQAPESPWVLPPHLFERAAETPHDTPSRRSAMEALPNDGTVLDVGCGAGAASLALAQRRPVVTGVDDSDDMLDAFRKLAARAELNATAVKGRWPDVAGAVQQHDVVVCHHVVYNVPDIVPFIDALHAKARTRVVVELTAEHPRSTLNALWRRFWDLQRPVRPTADDLIAVVEELGHRPKAEAFDTTSNWQSLDEMTPWVRRWLCLPQERDDDVRRALEENPPPQTRRLAAVWWDAR
jgi:SAM-dependent methyltransferase